MKKAVALLAVLLVLAGGVAFGVNAMRDMSVQTAHSVRQAVIDAAVQCCAIEGAYPPDIAYLKENYGLAVSEAYIVDYEMFASNILPEVTVIPR